MIVYAVLGYEQYYPLADNCIGMFSTIEKAEAFASSITGRRYTYVEVVSYNVE